MIKLSKTSKMPRKCKSWSTEAIDTCPGSIESRIKDVVVLVDACKGCYATTGMYNMPNVKAPRIHNKQDWKRKDWEDDMVEALRDDELFRWFDSGDCYDLRLAKKIKNIIMRTPKTKHWFPTRQHKFPKFTQVLTDIAKLANAVVRLSSDSVNGGMIRPDTTSSTIIPHAEDATPEMTVCRAYDRQGKCGDCRACWDKTVKVIAYPAHGRKMIKVINILAL
tara:strand:+ start:228 stop:890 length:663 start_codon:yes stop_codon:yes gene_type:complete